MSLPSTQLVKAAMTEL